MGREYSNRRPTRKRSSAPSQFLVIIVSFLLGYLTSTVLDVQTISRWLDAQVLAQHETKQAQQQSKTEAKQEAATPPKPKFEFYTLLANEKVPNSQAVAGKPSKAQPAVQTLAAKAPEPIAKTTGTAVQTAAVKTAETATPKSHPVVAVVNKPRAPVAPAVSAKAAYSVQVASFKLRNDAEHMKGVLALKGFSVMIVPISHATKGNWFRVVVGPFPNRALAQNAQMNLNKRARLRGMIVAG